MKLPGAPTRARSLRLRRAIKKHGLRLTLKVAVCLLPLLLTGCFHRADHLTVQPLAPPIADTPPPPPEPAPTDLPTSVVSVPNQTLTPAANAQAQPAPKPPVRHKRRAPSNTTELASNGSPGVSAIGQLSSGDGSDLRQPTLDSIAATERGLNGIRRKLSGQEQKTAAQIREFLKQARAALASGDVDGAQTLAVKAKVLLDELTR